MKTLTTEQIQWRDEAISYRRRYERTLDALNDATKAVYRLAEGVPPAEALEGFCDRMRAVVMENKADAAALAESTGRV